jgi:hypothetical protein
VLEAEAHRQHAGYLLRPVSDDDFLGAINRCLRPEDGNAAQFDSVPAT